MQTRFLNSQFLLVWRVVLRRSLTQRKAYLTCLMAVLVFALGMVSQANAALTTYDVTFTASFDTGPYSSVTGSFTATFDPTASVLTDLPIPTPSISIAALNIPSGMTYDNPIDFFTAGGLTGGVGSISGTDWWIEIEHFTTIPTFYISLYQLVSPDAFGTDTGTVTVKEVSAVPIPPSALLLGSGLLGLAGLRRFRKS